MSKIIFLHTICHNSHMFRSILIIFMDLFNISKVYKNRGWIIKYTKPLKRLVIRFIILIVY
jgi:hypothetical protein